MAATKSAKPRQICVFTEGKATEPDYIQHWSREHRQTVKVVIDKFHGGPLQLVDRAIKRRTSEQHEARRGRGEAFDEYWCVFGRDEHQNFDLAVIRAVSNGIGIAHSNPCIELWFMLHFSDQTSFIDRHDAQRASKKLLGCEKRLTPQALKELQAEFCTARCRAQALNNKHHLDGSAPRSNPSSDVWRLITSIARHPERISPILAS